MHNSRDFPVAFSASGIALRSVLVGLLIAVIASSAAGQIKINYRHSFEPAFEQKRLMNKRFRPEVKRLGAVLLDRQRRGDEAVCSLQIHREVVWLMNYTNQAERLQRRLADLRGSLEVADQDFATDQQASDGSWGACYEEWFLKLKASVDPLRELLVRGERPRHPLKFMAPVGTPAALSELLEGLLISRVLETGVNHRKELNYVVSGLGQLLLLPEFAAVVEPDWPRQALAAAFLRFLDERWQNKETGYWGAWYEVDGKLLKTDDLSITFHIVSYRNGKVALLHQIVNSTFDLREQRYPFGWQDRGRLNNHHNYDVTRLLRYGWSHMTGQQKARAKAELMIMLSRSVRLTIDGDGAFYDSAYDSPAEAYYFGASFLDEVGYFRKSRQFWARAEFLGAEEVRRKLIANLRRLNSTDPMAQYALRKLELTE